MAEKITWRTEQRKLGELVEWERNPRRLSKHDAEHLAKSIDGFGVADPLIVNTDNHIIGGHMRRRVMLQSGYKPGDLVDVRVPSRALTGREAEELAIRLNRASGEWDFDALANGFEVDDLLEWGFTEEELNIEAEPIGEDPGAQVDRAEELREKWGVESGQLWRLGEHRLICGDCTDGEIVARLMGDEKAECMWTDPPYGVEYVGKTKDALTIENDGADDLPGLLTAAFMTAEKVLIGGAPFYVAHPPGALQFIFLSVVHSIGWKIHEQLVWVKDSMVMGHSDYHYKHEPILYGWTPGDGRPGRGDHEGSHWYGDNSQVSVFEIPRPKRSAEHPTMKPPELVEAHLKNSTQNGERVYEPFSGSGTTLIACERLGRKCRAVEISPAYVAVALQRWADMTGQTPELMD